VVDVQGLGCPQEIIQLKGDEAVGRREDCLVEGTSDEVGKARLTLLRLHM
jgi:hypothetical protein